MTCPGTQANASDPSVGCSSSPPFDPMGQKELHYFQRRSISRGRNPAWLACLGPCPTSQVAKIIAGVASSYCKDTRRRSRHNARNASRCKAHEYQVQVAVVVVYKLGVAVRFR